jgi:uncharacterized protein YbcC (UPF0753/DUF2309 family)
MNAPLSPALQQSIELAETVAAVCERIAPSFPLDRFIAVNPHWGWIDQPIEQAAAALGVLAGMKLLPEAQPQRCETLAEQLGWRDAVLHHLSQHCAAHFDAGQARWHAPQDGDEAGLYRSGLARLASDLALPWPQGRKAALAAIERLPRGALDAIGAALGRLGVPQSAHAPCLTVWLLDLNGWAAACAYRRWQARLEGGDDASLVELLALRAVWDALLADALPADAVQRWAQRWRTVDAAIAAERARQAPGWLRMAEREQMLQDDLLALLSRPPQPQPAAPQLQAVFCIDVRSEPLRRALEAADAGIATRGFAGFFGLPVAHQPFATDWRQPQLPGLLAPSLTVGEEADAPELGSLLAAQRRRRLAASAAWHDWRTTPAAGLPYVEACGWLAAYDLLRASLPQLAGSGPDADWSAAGLKAEEAAALRPRLAPSAGVGQAAALAAGVLRAMGMIEGFAPLVLLCGHGGQSANNPHAAGLDCGACGGRSGEVNARALAALLNDPAVRAALAAEGIRIDAGCWFVAGLHNTTTDEVALFDLDLVPAEQRARLERLQTALAHAGAAVRAERAPGLGLAAAEPARLLEALRRRASHWAETRPEWALADNAAFIAAPRARTRGADLGGRVFLHDYDARLDADGSVLTLILTAPVVVAHWINLQYLTSSVDPLRHGAGNKLLHNVVGGGIGVFEGNGGDLRIGLPWQSVHDGERLRHTPRRLSVFIEAARTAVDAVLAAQVAVRRLVDHGWIVLFAIEADPAGAAPPRVWQRARGGGWQPAACGGDEAPARCC